MEKKSIISAKNISIGYQKTYNRPEHCLYNNLSFDLYTGELVCLLGVNGAGKSTLLRSLSGTQSILKGEIAIDNTPLNTISSKRLSKLLGLVLTDKTSVGGLKVRELVELGRYPYTGFFGQLTRHDRNVIDKAMTDVSILHKADSYCAELSDGERQKAMIAKSLAQECPIIILDEPTAFLDITSRIEITILLREFAIKHNKSILLSTHDIELALLLGDRLWMLSPEYGFKSGVTEDLVLSDDMDRFFGKNNIKFDKQSGTFLPYFSSNKYIYIQSPFKELYYWTKNLFTKHGYTSIDKPTDGIISVYISSPNEIKISKYGIEYNYSSFEQIINQLDKQI